MFWGNEPGRRAELTEGRETLQAGGQPGGGVGGARLSVYWDHVSRAGVEEEPRPPRSSNSVK